MSSSASRILSNDHPKILGNTAANPWEKHQLIFSGCVITLKTLYGVGYRISFIQALQHGIHLPDVSGGLLCLAKNGLLSELNALHTYWNCKAYNFKLAWLVILGPVKRQLGASGWGCIYSLCCKDLNIWELLMSQHHFIKNVGPIYNNSKIKKFS